MREGNPAGAYDLFCKAVELGNRFKDADLLSLGQLGCGQALIQLHKMNNGTKLLDESMVAVVSGETSPIVTGIIYCAVIETCQKIYDLHRAQEWTVALNDWCETHPDLFPYRGQCLIRRAELLQLNGEWANAESEIQKACEHFAKPPLEVAAGEAFYLSGEISRLKGQFSRALEMYRQASKWGFKPQPGLAILRLTQGQTDVARAAINQTEKEKQDPISRSKILPAYVDIMIESGETLSAQIAADELDDIALAFSAPFLQAIAAYVRGKILLASGRPADAMEQLRIAFKLFQKSTAVYELAKTRLLIGLACRDLGDTDTAKLEFESARDTFQQLGAIPDLKSVDKLLPKNQPHGLTSRELEVLKHLTMGKTNKEIAADLFLSERTIDRHVSNILMKIDVPSRAAATAYAYKYNLV
jgi:ATP/maltotriose-dependent transcriptional regulator MalT